MTNRCEPAASCCDDHDPQSLPVSEALARIDALIEPLAGFERVALRSALGRALAETIRSPIDVPAHVNSAMDGYALRHADLAADGESRLRVVGTSLAGAPWEGEVSQGAAVRIMTGAVLPAGADCVVMQEQTQRDGEVVVISGRHRIGQNIRQAGEDLARGEVVLEPGRALAPADLGVLASLGFAEVMVRRRLRVAFFSTGDELRSVGETLRAGDIYDSNRYSIHGMLTRLGVEVIDMGVVRDDPQALREAFTLAAASADAVITSGGVSVGEADFIKDILADLGQIDFWKIAMKPGRPLAFGRLGSALFFGLPGNPVSVMVTFYQFALAALRRLGGYAPEPAVRVRVPLVGRLRKRPGRTEFQRGVLASGVDGTLAVRGVGEQGSGILSSMSRANCFIVLASDCGDLDEGAMVEVQPFHGLV